MLVIHLSIMSIYQSFYITKLFYLKGQHYSCKDTRICKLLHFTYLHLLQYEVCTLHIRTLPYRTNLLKKKDEKEKKSE